MSGGTESVTIVVPTYRNVDFVERAVDSALAQTYPHLDVCIADHESDDGTWEVLQQYADEPRVRLMRTPAGGGAARNWNAVSRAATGRYVKLLCGDDVLYPTCVQQQVQAFQEHPDAVLVAARRDLVDVSDAVLWRGRGLGSLRGHVAGATAIRALVRSGTNLLGEPASVLLRRSVLDDVGGWSDDYPYLIDQFTYMRVLERGPMVAVDEVLGAFRLSDTQWSVRLVNHQVAQARGVHAHVRASRPDLVRGRDRFIGDLRVAQAALLRRLAYRLWRRRLSHG